MNSSHKAPPPSGAQHEIRHGAQWAIVTEVGATLRHYSVDGADVVDGFGVDEQAPGARGQVLAPWPNRLDAGSYRFGDRDGRAALNDPDHGNAIHGLVRWLPWTLESKATDAVELACVLHPQPGYPWQLALRVGYRLDATGLSVSFRASNASDVVAPFGIGFHPYLSVDTIIDDAVLEIPAARRLVTDDRSLPVGSRLVAGSEFDFRTPRAIGSPHLDTCYTDLARTSDGLVRALVGAADGSRRVALWADASIRYLMVYTGDTLGDLSRRRRAVALEPMTCPPNALRSGCDVLEIPPGQDVAGRWGISALR